MRQFSNGEGFHRTFYGECGIHLTCHYAGNDDVVLNIWRPYLVITVETAAREGWEVLRPSRMGNEEDGPSWVRSVIEGRGKRQNK